MKAENENKRRRSGYRVLRSLADLTMTFVIFELAVSLLLYFAMPYIGQHGGSMFGMAIPGGSFQVGGAPFQIHDLRFGAYMSAMPFYFGVLMLALSLLTLFASFFSLRWGLITLSALGFGAIAFSGYAWILSDTLGGLLFTAATFAGLVFAIIFYAAQLRLTSSLDRRSQVP